MTDHEKVADNIKSWFGRKGTKMIDVASAMEISTEALRLKRNGTTPFTIDDVGRIANYLGIPFTTLLDGVGQTKEAS